MAEAKCCQDPMDMSFFKAMAHFCHSRNQRQVLGHVTWVVEITATVFNKAGDYYRGKANGHEPVFSSQIMRTQLRN